jgi:hypothetical protein
MKYLDEYKYKISDVEHEQNHMEELSKNTRDCKHGHLARKCEMCENEKLESSLSAAVTTLKEIEGQYLKVYEELALSTQFKNGLGVAASIATQFFTDHPELRGK